MENRELIQDIEFLKLKATQQLVKVDSVCDQTYCEGKIIAFNEVLELLKPKVDDNFLTGPDYRFD